MVNLAQTFLYLLHTQASGQEAWISDLGKGYFFITFKAGEKHRIIHLNSDSGTSGHVQKSREHFPRKHKMFGGEHLEFSPVVL